MPALAAAVVGLDKLRRRLVDDQLQAEIDLATPGVSARAATAAAADPLRERTVVLHVRALAAEDRAAEALEVAARYAGGSPMRRAWTRGRRSARSRRTWPLDRSLRRR